MEKNAMGVDDEERESDLLTAKIDEITGGEMKKVGVQKMENELTIKKLDREYLDIKRNLIYSKKMLDEARKNVSTQSETKNQLLHANKAIIEKFNELKKYQNEITLNNLSKGEKSLQDCTERNNECTKILRIILDKDNYFDFLLKNLVDKGNQLNEDIQKQIEQKKECVNNSEETLSLLAKKIESQQIQIDGEKIDNPMKHAMEEKNKRIIQSQADFEELSKQITQESEDLQQKKLRKIRDLENHKSDIATIENGLSDLQSLFSETEQHLIALHENLENVTTKSNAISTEIHQKRDLCKQSNESFTKNVSSLQDQLAVANCELQNEQVAFEEIENKMQDDMKQLFTELEEKKKLHIALENHQRDLSKIKEKRIEQQKLLSQNCVLDENLSNLTEEYKKQLSIGSTNTNKQIELNSKIKNLREKRDHSRKQLENLSKMQSHAAKVMNYSNDSVSKVSADNITSSQNVDCQKKLNDFYHSSRQVDKNLATNQIPKKTLLYSDNFDKSLAFNLDSSDESEDDIKIIDKTSKKLAVSTVTPLYKKQDYVCDFEDKIKENPSNEKLSQSERLFDELISSQNLTESSVNKKDKDIFKIPATYTPMRKRSTQTKKY